MAINMITFSLEGETEKGLRRRSQAQFISFFLLWTKAHRDWGAYILFIWEGGGGGGCILVFVLYGT